MSNDYIIELRNISKTFGAHKALDNVSLKVKKGEVHALVGENGAGKSTLIKIICGVYHPDNGAEVYVNGNKVIIKNPVDAINNGISVIYQDISLFPNLTVAENICIGNKKAWSHKLNWKKIHELSEQALKKVGMNLDTKTKLQDLSIASQQIVAIARAINFNSEFIIMDEPTSTLSSNEVKALYGIVENLKKEGISVLFISHKFDEIYTVADSFTVLRDGKFIDTGSLKDVNEQQLIKLMVGRDVQYLSLKGTNISNEVIFEAKNLNKKGNFKDINFNLRKGEILGITGLVGSGRSELAKAIFGLATPDSGEIFLNNSKLNIKSAEDAVKNGIAYVPENRQLEGLVLDEHLCKNINLPVFESKYGRFGLVKYSETDKIAEKYIEEIDVRPRHPKKLARLLSGGNQQKVVIGKWLNTSPKLLIVDEPTNGVDIGAKVEIHKLLRKLADQGIGVIVISSELPEIQAVSDRIMVMKQGTVVGIVENNNISQEEIMAKALGA